MSSTGESNSDNYITVRLLKELMQEIEAFTKRRIRGYKNRSEFIKEARNKKLRKIASINK